MCEIAVVNGGVDETDGTVHLGIFFDTATANILQFKYEVDFLLIQSFGVVNESVAVAEIKQAAVLERQRLDVAAHFLLGQVLEQLVFFGIMIGINVEMRGLHRLLDFRMQRIGNAV